MKTAFEIGCNMGANLKVLESLGIEAMGCDVNAYAVDIAILTGLKAYVADGRWLPVGDYDLVFTVGVLIHLRTPDLIMVMKNLVKMSRKYVMFAEYEGTDEEVPYRGERCALFKRQFGKIFEALFPVAELMETGYAGKEEGFDNVTYWVYDVSNCSSKVGFTTTTWESFEIGEGEEFISTPSGTAGEVGKY
jgi:hypothetical protein